jgi:muramoyltetrapeptide carboxypeptidase
MLSGVAGIGVGHLVDCTHARYPEPTAREVVIEKLAALGRPLVLDLPFGHGQPNFAWPLGARARLDGGRGRLEILERGVVPRR